MRKVAFPPTFQGSPWVPSPALLTTPQGRRSCSQLRVTATVVTSVGAMISAPQMLMCALLLCPGPSEGLSQPPASPPSTEPVELAAQAALCCLEKPAEDGWSGPTSLLIAPQLTHSPATVLPLSSPASNPVQSCAHLSHRFLGKMRVPALLSGGVLLVGS